MPKLEIHRYGPVSPSTWLIPDSLDGPYETDMFGMAQHHIGHAEGRPITAGDIAKLRVEFDKKRPENKNFPPYGVVKINYKLK